MDATKRHVAESGPSINCLDEPIKAYTIIGNMLEYKPACGGSPIIAEYAIPIGSTIAATESPAKISLIRYSLLYVWVRLNPGKILNSFSEIDCFKNISLNDFRYQNVLSEI